MGRQGGVPDGFGAQAAGMQHARPAHPGAATRGTGKWSRHREAATQTGPGQGVPTMDCCCREKPGGAMSEFIKPDRTPRMPSCVCAGGARERGGRQGHVRLPRVRDGGAVPAGGLHGGAENQAALGEMGQGWGVPAAGGCGGRLRSGGGGPAWRAAEERRQGPRAGRASLHASAGRRAPPATILPPAPCHAIAGRHSFTALVGFRPRPRVPRARTPFPARHGPARGLPVGCQSPRRSSSGTAPLSRPPAPCRVKR